MRNKLRRRPARRRHPATPRDTDRLLHDLLQALPTGLHLYELTRDGRLVFAGANPAADRILGVKNAAFVGKTIEEAFPPLTDTEIPTRYREVARTGKAWRVERFEYVHGGIRGAYDVHAFPIGPGRIAVLFADVSARLRAEREIEADHHRYMALFEEARDAIFLADPATGAILDANREAVRLTGRSRAELLGLRQEALHPPEDAERCRAIFREHVTAGGGASVETSLLARDGRRIPVEVRASVIDLGAGRRVIQEIFHDLTERMETEARLRAMASEWQATFGAVTDAVYILDADQRIRRCNRAATDFFRRNEGKLLGHPCWEFLHGGAPHSDCPFRRMQKSRQREVMELQIGDRWFRVVVDPLFDGTGRLAGAVHILQDITDLRKASDKLRSERDRAQRYLDVADVLLVALDATGTVTLVNRKGCEILGRPEAEIVGRGWFGTFLPERIRSKVRAVFDRLMRGEVEPVEHFENPVLTARGSERLIAWRNTLLRDATGRITGTLSSGEDVTDRRRSETALIASETRLRATLRAAPVGIGIVIDRVFQSVNERLCDMTGYAAPELLGRDARLLYPTDEEYANVGRSKYGQIAERGLGTVETRWLRKDGAILDILLSSAPLDPADLRLGVVFSALDITDRKRAEERYLHAQKMESVGRLAGGVAHDFNNLLTVVTSSAELLKTEVADRPGSAERVEQIRLAARRAADLTRQLLLFSRRQPARTEQLDLNHVLSDAVRLLKRLIGEDIRFSTAFAPEPLPVRADPGQLVQVLMNLAVNARDAMPAGGTLDLETARVELDAETAARVPEGRTGTFARMIVRDTGDGIPPELQPRIFEPFFTTKEVGKGTGLGLATVYGIVRQSGGFIEVESVPERGTTFRIYLPAVDAPTSTPSAGVDTLPVRGGSETVLVVEDELGVRTLLVEVLRSHGYSVHAAETPDQALQLVAAETGTIHLLVTDCVMPQMNGRELALQLAAARPRLKVLFISGYSDGHSPGTAPPPPDAPFLPKPFAPDALARKVREVLDAEPPAAGDGKTR